MDHGQRRNTQSRLFEKSGLTGSNLSETLDEIQFTNDATEKALIRFFSHFDDPGQLIRDTDYATTQNGIFVKIPFNSSRKYALAVVKNTNDDDNGEGYFTVYIKGAAEVIWDLCTHMYEEDQYVEIDARVQEQY
jgi:magnesium-transporting ATPase (P-type)